MSYFGSAKSSSGSTPSESSGSQPDESSSGSSFPTDESSSGVSSGVSSESESSLSSSTGACSWTVSIVVLYDTQNGDFTITNTGGVDLTVNNVTVDVGDFLVTPAQPVVIAPGDSLLFSVNTIGGDLTGAFVFITTSCGEKDFQF